MSLVEGFKNALSCWCSGVSVVSTKTSEGLYGLTVSSFSSVSLDPPLISVCIDNRNRFPSMVGDSGHFAVSLLGTDQEAASNFFASKGRVPSPDFGEIETTLTDSGQPVLAGSMAWLSCVVHQTVVAGDHTIVIGRVLQTRASDAQPLLYFRRAYRTVTD